MAKIKIDKEKCIGCGLCVTLNNKVFEIKNQKAAIKPGQEKVISKEVVEGCPVQAISY